MMPLSTSQPSEVQEWNTLRAWLKEDPQGTALLERLQRDPIGTQQELKDWLFSRSKDAPAAISTLITGGNVEKLVNIASANNVIFNLTATPQALHQLPPDISEFTGRQSDVEETIKALDPKNDSAVAPMVGISGMPGVGKSALAIHVCHQLRDAFPDAQLYVNLRGDSSTNMVKPADAAATLLLSLKFSGDDESTEVLTRVEQKPTSEGRVRELAEVLDERMKADPTFAKELASLVKEAGQDPGSGTFVTQVMDNAKVGKIVNIGTAGDVSF